MIIDVNTAKISIEQLKRCLKRMEEYREMTHRVFLELIDTETDSIREVALELRRNLKQTEKQIDSLRQIIRALEKITNVYQRTEKKNIAKFEGINLKIKDMAHAIRLDGNVPSDIADLFE